MEDLMTYVPIAISVLYIIDKIVKATPTKYDDFVVDVILKGLESVVKRNSSEEKKEEKESK